MRTLPNPYIPLPAQLTTEQLEAVCRGDVQALAMYAPQRTQSAHSRYAGLVRRYPRADRCER